MYTVSLHAKYHSMSIVLSKSNHEITLDFTTASKLVASINFNLQKMVYEHKNINQETELEKDKILNENEEFFQENFELASRLEQETEDAIIENKKKLSFQKNALFHTNSRTNSGQ